MLSYLEYCQWNHMVPFSTVEYLACTDSMQTACYFVVVTWQVIVYVNFWFISGSEIIRTPYAINEPTNKSATAVGDPICILLSISDYWNCTFDLRELCDLYCKVLPLLDTQQWSASGGLLLAELSPS